MALFSRHNKAPQPENSDSGGLTPSPGSESPVHSIDAGLRKSRLSLREGFGRLLGTAPHLDDSAYDRLEDLLLSGDIGVKTSLQLVEELRNISKRQAIRSPGELLGVLRVEIGEILAEAQQQWRIDARPHVIMMVGVNGVGKTTTTAKIAHYLSASGHSVIMAAADTFRAAAVGQLREWGARLDIPVIAQGDGADAAAVAHDALTAAMARKTDVLLIDTAGRLHTQTDLMGQLQKMKRVLTGIDPLAPHEVLQVIDAGTGQNAISQLGSFNQSLGVDSVVVTKLDGSAKGGILVALTAEFKIPVRFVGVGEAFEDLRPFNACAYTDALLPADLLVEPAGPA